MNIKQALSTLENPLESPPSERLRAARLLARQPASIDQGRLTAIRSAERNFWVRQALDRAIEGVDQHSRAEGQLRLEARREAEQLDSRRYGDAVAEATVETSALFLHELRPLIGLLDATASCEIADYKTSRTKEGIDRIKNLLDALDRLRLASEPPQVLEFDLTDLAGQVASQERLHYADALSTDSMNTDDEAREASETSSMGPSATLELARTDPVVTIGDPALVEMALANTLRNAIEAVLEMPSDHDGYITLNWGRTDLDSWISVLDNGCGLPDGWDRVTEPGVSTKSKTSDHAGMGLSIAKRAIESMGGTLQLTPRSTNGVKCEIRWPTRGLLE